MCGKKSNNAADIAYSVIYFVTVWDSRQKAYFGIALFLGFCGAGSCKHRAGVKIKCSWHTEH